MGPRTATVIGAGPAGLVAALCLRRAGVRVAVLEARGEPGGRASSDVVDGFTLNQGPHAIYLGGPARRILRDLGLEPKGRLPVSARADGVGADGRRRTLLRPGLVRLAARAARTSREDAAATTAAEWLGDDPLLQAAARVVTYTDRLDALSADALLGQLKAAAPGVRYVHGGWQSIVDALAGAVGREAIRTGAAVRSVSRGADGRWTAATDDAEVTSDVVVLAGLAPERVSTLLGLPVAPPGPEAVASVLDLGLERLPKTLRRFAIGLDEPRYLSVHSPPARLAERGVLVSLASYGRAPRSALESFADAVQPGWRDVAITTRHLAAMTVTTALPTPETGGLAGRPGVAVPEAPGAFVAGDWVGPEGLLLDAAVSSAVAAATAAVDRGALREVVAA